MEEAMLVPAYDRRAMLVDAADVAGRPVPYRRLVDWVQLGLVPAPTRHGLGRGRGTVSRWSEFARRQWLAQLVNRTRADVATMCNLPIGYWVYAAISPVTDTQAARAMFTWAARRAGSRAGHLRRSAEQTIARVAEPLASARDRRRLVKLLAEEALGSATPEALVPPAVRPVVAPGATGRRGTRQRAAAEALSVELAAQVLGAQRLLCTPHDPRLWADLAVVPGLVRAATRKQVSDVAEARRRAGLVGVSEPLLGFDRLPLTCLDVAEALGILRLRELGVVTR